MNNTDYNRYNEHGQKHGYWVVRHADGCEERGIYVNGARHGHWDLRGYGNVSADQYVSSKQNGIWKLQGAYGGEAEGNMVNGKRHGRWIFQNALSFVSEGPFVDGDRHGQWIFRAFDVAEVKAEYRHGVLVEN
ncbi:MAG: hypothetical protein OXU96_00110 [Gammaproteobacteria bacterium]|nr:hypothetical protein [Gammaproteobacteria bacterium]